MALAVAVPSTWAQQDFAIGTGATGNTSTTYPCPLQDHFEGNRAQYLFKAAELTAAGINSGRITAIKFNVLQLNGVGTIELFRIRISSTTVNSLATNAWETLNNPVGTAAADYDPVTGSNTFTLPAPFEWNGTDNIIVEVCSGTTNRNSPIWGPIVHETANPTIAWTTGLSFNASHTYGANNQNGLCGTIQTAEAGTATTRPNLTFTWIPPIPDCTGTPTAGTITSSVTGIICSTTEFKLKANGLDEVKGLTFQWQSLNSSNMWVDIAAAEGDSLVSTAATTTRFRLAVTCSHSSQTVYTNVLEVSVAPLVSGVFTIDNSVANSGGGVFKSFTEAFNYIRCGINNPVVFNVVNNAMPYEEQLIMTAVPGASATNTITFNGNGAALRFLSTDDNERAVIKLNGADHMIIDSLRITALATTDSEYGYGIHFMNDADSNIIRKCTISVAANSTTSYHNGIVISGDAGATTWGSYCDANVIDRNTIIGGMYGISIVGGTPFYEDFPVLNNKVTNNTIRNFYQYGVYLTNTALTLLDGNDLSRPGRTSSPDNVYGFHLSSANMGDTISGNRIHAFFDGHLENAGTSFYGISLSNADAEPGLEHLVANNMIYDIKGLGTIYALYNNGSNLTNYYYNTISLDDPASASLKPAYGFYGTFNLAGVNLKNNIFSITRNGAGFKYGIYLADDNYSLLAVDNNNFFFNGNPTVMIGFAKANEYASLADWRTATTFDLNSTVTDPGFKNAAGGDFTPTSAAFADKGTPVSVVDDLNGKARHATTPDMGAIEFTLQSCNTSFLAGDTYSSVGNATCVNKQILLNLKNNDVGLGLTYQWQSTDNLSGTWTNISTPLVAPPHTVTASGTTLYYRAAVSCNAGTPSYSTPVQIAIGGHFPAGTYTVDATQPTDPAGTRNFRSLNDVASVISCGITGPVLFNVKPGVYNEQVRFPAIPNSSAQNTITFQSENGNAETTTITFNASSVGTNYTIKLDSASHFIFKNLTIASLNQIYGRTVDIANLASDINVLNCIIKASLPDASDYATYGGDQTMVAGIHAATGLKGGGLIIKGNKFVRGAKGIYIVGAAARPSGSNVIESNVFDSSYHQSIYVQNASNLKIINNAVPVKTTYEAASYNQGVYGIYTNNCDTALEISGNTISLQNNAGYMYGIYMTGNDGTANARGKILNNTILARDGLTSLVTGIYNGNATYLDVVNNEISVHSTIDGIYNWEYATGIYSENAAYTNYYNNSVLNTSPSPGIYNTAFSADHQYANGGGFTNVYNNVFANTGNGPALFYNYTAEHIQSDYNLLYTNGALLVKQGPTDGSFEKDFTDIAAWRTAYGTEMHSIVYQPAYTSDANLKPDITNNKAWAMHGRGIQLAGNSVDKTGLSRSVTLTDGVPDLGAYEFLPTVEPPVLTAIPAVPAAGSRQVFMMGTDTVTAITWASGAGVPSAISLKRYSGVLPVGLAATEKSLYYYVNADVTGAGNYKYKAEHFYLDPWRNTLPQESFIKLGKTDAANVWTASANSTIDSLSNIITEDNLVFIGKFTGMTDGNQPQKPTFITTSDSTNKGTRFWAPYGLTRDQYQGNGQSFKFVLSSDVATQVTVSVNGTPYKKSYAVPAGGIVTTEAIPKSGAYDARLRGEGLFDHGVLIESEKPVAVTAFMEGEYNYSLLLPTGTYGKSYTTLGARQFSGYPGIIGGRSWVNVIADADNTVVEITPANNTEGGRQAGVPFRVTLNRGEVYQVIGAYIRSYTQAETGGIYNENSYAAYDLTGTKVVSVANSAGDCKPVAVFSGSSATGIRCEALLHGADHALYQQAYPSQAWGTQFLTAPLASQNATTELLFNIFRVLVKDVNTVVKRNGVQLTNRTGNYYEFTSREPEYIEADKPVMVGQFTTYFTACGNDEYDNPGSNESMFYLTPIGYGLKETDFYVRAAPYAWDALQNYITLIVPTAGVAALEFNGDHTYDRSYVHPQLPGYTVVMKKYDNVDSVIHVKTDQDFTALVHAPSNNYGFVYNVGFKVPRVDFSNGTYHNVHNQDPLPNTYTCVGTPFKPTVHLPVIAKTITWKFSSVTGITPATDITVNNPVPIDTVVVASRNYYVYELNQELKFSQTGTYDIPVIATYSEDPATCDVTVNGKLTVVVIDAPVVDYTTNYTGCINAAGAFNGTGTAGNGAVVDRWSWSFGDNTTATTQNATKTWNAAGTYAVVLTAIANDGCIASASKAIEVKPLPVLVIVNDNQGTCPGGSVTFQIKDPVAGVVYSWYSAITGGTALATGTTFTVNNLPGAATYYASANQNGCDIATRVAARVYLIPNVVAPVAAVDSLGVRALKFKWNAVANATGYEVSIDNGNTWNVPSSGNMGLTHTINGLAPGQRITLLVRALGGCEQKVAVPVEAITLTDRIFIPNSFTPNGDGTNDEFKVYGNDIKSIRFMVFNQWGQKLFETGNIDTGWDGKYGGKMQPSGVYVYVCSIVLITGEEVTRKGNINLVR
jgi:gliding motility-associated-like protein